MKASGAVPRTHARSGGVVHTLAFAKDGNALLVYQLEGEKAP
jgi:hypothetical protein